MSNVSSVKSLPPNTQDFLESLHWQPELNGPLGFSQTRRLMGKDNPCILDNGANKTS